jgi:hypothetical protein
VEDAGESEREIERKDVFSLVGSVKALFSLFACTTKPLRLKKLRADARPLHLKSILSILKY